MRTTSQKDRNHVRQKTLTIFAVTALTALLIASAHAGSVLFVDDETPDSSWSTLITGGGHSYSLFDTGTYNLSLNNQDSIDYVESFDVAIISGSNPAFNALRAHGATWNTLATPMVNMGNYLLSGQYSATSWQWTTPTTGGASNASGTVDVLDAGDGIWTGVTLTPGSPETASLFGGNAGHLNLGSDSLLSGITAVAAQTSNNELIAIAHAAPNALLAGSQEQYFLAGMTGGSGNPVTFSADGETVFLNAIDTLSGKGIPEPASLALLGLSGLALLNRRRRR